MDCFNHPCSLRINNSSNFHRCECVGCPNRNSGNYVIAWNRTLTTDEEMDEIKRKLDTNYGVGNWC